MQFSIFDGTIDCCDASHLNNDQENRGEYSSRTCTPRCLYFAKVSVVCDTVRVRGCLISGERLSLSESRNVITVHCGEMTVRQNGTISQLGQGL